MLTECLEKRNIIMNTVMGTLLYSFNLTSSTVLPKPLHFKPLLHELHHMWVSAVNVKLCVCMQVCADLRSC